MPLAPAQALGLSLLLSFLLFFLSFWLSLLLLFCISFSLCVYLIPFSASLFFPHILPLHLSLSSFAASVSMFLLLLPAPMVALPPLLSLSPSTVSPPSLCPLAGRMGEEAQGRCGLGFASLPLGCPGFQAFASFYLGLQLPLIFWLQDTRPGLGSLGQGRKRQGLSWRVDEGQGAGRCVPWGACIFSTGVAVHIWSGVHA